MNLSTHSDTCIQTPSASSVRKGMILRPSSVPHDLEMQSSQRECKSPDSNTSDERELEDSIVMSGEYSVRYLLNQ